MDDTSTQNPENPENGDMSEEEMMRQWEEGLQNSANFVDQGDVDDFFGVDKAPVATGLDLVLNPPKVKHERLHMLELILKDTCKDLGGLLRQFLSAFVSVDINDIEMTRFDRYIESCPMPTIFSIYTINPWGSPGLLRIDSALLYSFLNVSMGGKDCGLHIGGKIEGKNFTSFEMKLSHTLSDFILRSFSRSFERITPISCTVDRQEFLPKFTGIVPGASACLACRISINLEKVGGVADLVIPISSVEPVRNLLAQNVTGEKWVDNIWQLHFSKQLKKASVPLMCTLPTLKISLNEVLSWKVGDTFTFSPFLLDQIEMRVEDHVFATGKLGRKKSKAAVQIMGFVQPKKRRKVAHA